jgi:GNAT superfamily N-acetyltransferase
MRRDPTAHGTPLDEASLRPIAVSLDVSRATQRPALFDAGDNKALALTLDDAATLQQFFDENPEYFLIVSGQVASPNAARELLEGDIPTAISYTRQFAIGFIDQSERLIGMADVVSDLMAPDVWHIGLFMVATKLCGRRLGSSLYQALEAWIEHAGARWIRLGVVIGNAVAERFWSKQHFTQMSMRQGVLIDAKLNDLRVMVKPLGDNQLNDYGAHNPRDRPTVG